MYFNVIAPIIIASLFIRPLIETMVVPDYISEANYKVIRIGFIVVTLCMRIMTFREEMQFYFNESYFLVQRLMIDKNEKIFRYIKLRIQENFQATWYSVF